MRAAAGSRTIYTPQMIVEGVDRVEGPRPMDVAELIQQYHAQVSPVTVSMTRAGDVVTIAARSTHGFPA